jgi:protein involved in polysaccharide export with SLBB domain/capsular polysaccharide biosynthesis protein
MNDINGTRAARPLFDHWTVMDLCLRHWLRVALCTLVAAAAGALIAHAIWSRSFSSMAQLIRYEPSSVDDSYHPRALVAPSLVVMLQAPGLLEEVGSSMQPAISGGALASRLDITLDRNNDVVTVTATGKSRAEAVDVVNRYCAAAIEYTRTIQRQEATEVGDNLNRNLAQVEAEIASTRRSIQPAAADPSAPEAESDMQSPEAPSALEARTQAAREQLDELLTRYTDAHPLVIQQRAEIAALEEESRHAAPAPSGGMQHRAGSSALPPPPSSLIYGRATASEVAIAERVRALESTRAILIERQRAIQPFRDNPPGYFRVLLSAAESPTQLREYRLQVLLFAIMGALAGFFGAIGQVLLAEYFDNRVKTRSDVRRITGLPLLATLGDLRRMSPEARDLWAFRSWTALRSRLSPSTNQGLVCGITSAGKGDGRTTWVDLLSRAACSCGFRVLTITSRPLVKVHGEVKDAAGRRQTGDADENLPDAGPTGGQPLAAAKVVDRLMSEDCPPVLDIPLPNWPWTMERRRQWRAAIEAWRLVDHVVIFVELPPAFAAESVLLAEDIPNLVWLVDRCSSDATDTLSDLDTLRQAGCNLVGSFLNREESAPLTGRFSRWLGSAALVLPLLASIPAMRASATGDAAPPAAADSFAVPGASWHRKLTLGPGDEVSLSLVGSPELTRPDVTIGSDGRISFLEARDIVADGLTIDELRSRVDDSLSHFRRAPRACVIPVAYHSKKYFVLGSVVHKGTYNLDHPVTIVEAVARASGFETEIYHGDTVDATDFSRAFLSRGGRKVPVDFSRLFMHGDLSQNVALEPGDYLYFPPSDYRKIYVLGAVGLPGSLPFEPGVSTISAIVARGGFTERAWKKHVLVVRGSLDHPMPITVDIAGALTGDAPNLALEPGDMVYVADRPWIRGEELLDHAASAFVESAVVTWTGLNVGPDIISAPNR